MDFVEAKNQVLERKIIWFGKSIVFIFPWCPFFTLDFKLSDSLPIWFSLPKLAFEFSNMGILEKIGNSFQKFLLLDSQICDGSFVIRICVLVNPNKTLLRACNIKHLDGTWQQSIIKNSDWFNKAVIVCDALLFKRLKITQSKSLNESLEKLDKMIKVISNQLNYDISNEINPHSSLNKQIFDRNGPNKISNL